MPELSKLLERREHTPEEVAEARERMRRTIARTMAWIDDELDGVPQEERWRFDEVPIHALRSEKVRYLAARSSQPVLVADPFRRTRSRESRPRGRRTRSASASRDGPSEPSDPPPLDRPLPAAERRHLKSAVDARRREVLAARPEVTLFDEGEAA